MAGLAAPPSGALPPWPLFRSVRLGLSALADRLAAVAELLQQPLLDQRSVRLSPALCAARLSLDSLLGRRDPGRHLHWRSRGRDPQLLLVDSPNPLIEGALRHCRRAPSALAP